MPRPKPFSKIALTEGFVRCLKKLAPETRKLADQALQDLLLPDVPGKYEFKKLKGYKNDNLFSITLGGNHAYKMSMEIRDGLATMRRVGTHKEIDESP